MSGNGYASHLFVFYLPAVLAISVAFNTNATAAFTTGILAAYLFATAPSLIDGSIAFAETSEGAAVATGLAMRIIVIVGIAVCGNAYWRMERDRRRGVSAPLTDENADVGIPVPMGET